MEISGGGMENQLSTGFETGFGGVRCGKVFRQEVGRPFVCHFFEGQILLRVKQPFSTNQTFRLNFWKITRSLPAKP
jgi:hypothetical protein